MLSFLGEIPYWIVQNSWGTSWGDEGYVHIKIGSNICGKYYLFLLLFSVYISFQLWSLYFKTLTCFFLFPRHCRFCGSSFSLTKFVYFVLCLCLYIFVYLCCLQASVFTVEKVKAVIFRPLRII